MKYVLLLAASAVFAQQPLHLIPPPGVPVPEADQRQLRTAISHLATRIDATKTNPHIPAVQIFLKAAQYALDGNEFFTAEEIFKAKELLRLGSDRMSAIEHGDAPWTRSAGLVVRGYVSRIDGSVQPYGLVVPSSYSPDQPHQWRVDAWFHGRSETLSEVKFLWARLHNPGQFTPRDTIVLHLYGRYCNASTFAGEVDFFEALDDVRKHFNVDDNRILVRGFSMGGASAWHIG